MPYIFNTSSKKDWAELVSLDPTIATYRRCTSEDMRALAIKTGWEYIRVQRAFNLHLFKRTRYLTLSLDPAFEPKPEVRERARVLLDKRARKRAHLLAVRLSAKKKALRQSISRKPERKRVESRGNIAKSSISIARYKF